MTDRQRPLATSVLAVASVIAAMAAPFTTLASQSFRARVDASMQRATYQGLSADSVARDLALGDSGGALFSPDGFRVRCGAGDQCYFFRPGPLLLSMPAVASGSITAWGLGVTGLSLRASGRLALALDGGDALPAIGPWAQLLEGYAEYQRRDLRVRAGRQLVTSRLEPMGFDGAAATLRFPTRALELNAYGGWGLDRASALPITDPALAPLDEWRPRSRQLVAGIEGAWALRYADLRAEYRREVDPVDDHFVSERSAYSVTGGHGALRAAAGVDVNHVEGRIGSSDLTLSYARARWSATAGVRRYRPYFSLWTLWGAFSPVGYNAQFASATLAVTSRLGLRGRAEHFAYDDAEISTALVTTIPDEGWRLSGGATLRLPHGVNVDGTASLDRGPGANARSGEIAVDFTPLQRVAVSLHAGMLRRPLELRWFDAADRWIGARADWTARDDRRVWAEVSAVGQERRRPDSAAARHDQLRLRAGISLSFGSRADRAPLPPALRVVH